MLHFAILHSEEDNMITLNYFVRKKASVSLDDFREYWLHEHANKMSNLTEVLGIQRYTKCETLHNDSVNLSLQQMYRTNSDSYDFVDQMVINDLKVFKEALLDPEIESAFKAIFQMDNEYVDFNGSDLWFSIDLAQVFPVQDCTATWENTLLKVFYVPRRHDHLTLEEAQLHWNSCHGGMAREFVSFLPFVKYIQGHKIESKVIDQLKSSIGHDFENITSHIGQAEAWITRQTVPTLQGPEIERMMGLLTQDIDLFVNSSSSHIFATKEHVIFKRPLFDSTIPSLFNAD